MLGCVPLLLGGFVACSGTPLAFGFGAVPAVEGGLVTFTTDAGVLAGPNDPSGDLDRPTWAGVIPVRTVLGEPEPAPGGRGPRPQLR